MKNNAFQLGIVTQRTTGSYGIQVRNGDIQTGGMFKVIKNPDVIKFITMLHINSLQNGGRINNNID